MTSNGDDRVCFKIDQKLGEPGGCRHFLNWYDSVPRREMRLCLISEVSRTISVRKHGESHYEFN